MVPLAKKPYAYQELSDLPIKKKRVHVRSINTLPLLQTLRNAKLDKTWSKLELSEKKVFVLKIRWYIQHDVR